MEYPKSHYNWTLQIWVENLFRTKYYNFFLFDKVKFFNSGHLTKLFDKVSVVRDDDELGLGRFGRSKVDVNHVNAPRGTAWDICNFADDSLFGEFAEHLRKFFDISLVQVGRRLVQGENAAIAKALRQSQSDDERGQHLLAR